MLSRSLRFFIIVFAIVLVLSVMPVYAATLVVHPGNFQDWVFWECGDSCTNGDITPTFVNGPGTPLIGQGSLAVSVADPSSKFLMGRQDYEFLHLAELETLSF